MTNDLPWWKKKELSLQRKEKERRSSASPGDSFLIVTEGTVTEPVYFDLLRKSLQLSTVTVKVMPGKAPDPRHVIQSAADEVNALAERVKLKEIAVTELEKYDHVWAVIDTDVAVRDGFWNDVVQKARDLKVKLAHSTPCFEYWLLLHLKRPPEGTWWTAMPPSGRYVMSWASTIPPTAKSQSVLLRIWCLNGRPHAGTPSKSGNITNSPEHSCQSIPPPRWICLYEPSMIRPSRTFGKS